MEVYMAILKVKFDNIVCFNDFEANFTYPKKLVKSPLNDEYLLNYPNIRYKKVNIIIGSNATGKTSLGIVIWKTLRFLIDKEAKPIKDLVTNKDKLAYILLDAAFGSGHFFRIEIKILTDGNVMVRYYAHNIKKSDTYESIVNSLDADLEYVDYLEGLKNVSCCGFNFNFPPYEKENDFISCYYEDENKEEFRKIYEDLLRTFDPSIKEVIVSSELNDTYVIKFYNGKTVAVTHSEKVSTLPYLSSGTKNVVNIASLIYSIKHHQNGFYYADELFSFVNSDIEIACLTKMVELLGDGEQLFFTTHNADVMDISLPMHSYNFLKKIKYGNEFKVELLNASSFEKRNNVSVRHLYDNDCFEVAPDIMPITLGEKYHA